ncbi:MAG TPA: hypothetical protein VF156_14990, partial [Agromyces sp.]
MGAPSFIMTGGRPGAEYVSLGLQVIAPAVFAVAGLIAAAVYRVAPSRVPHPVLAAITAGVVWAVIRGLELAAPAIGIGVVSAYLTSVAALAAAGAVFVGLTLAVALHRRAVRVVAAGGTGADTARWAPRLPLAVIVVIAALAAAIPPVIAVIRRDLEVRGEASVAASGADIAMYAVLGALPAVVTAAWAVLVVLLVDEWSSPRMLRATGAAAMTALALAVPALVIGGGLEY